MLWVGLTGGIGSGKSAVSERLASRGAAVVDADRVAREVVEPGTPGLAAVVEGEHQLPGRGRASGRQVVGEVDDAAAGSEPPALRLELRGAHRERRDPLRIDRVVAEDRHASDAPRSR